MIPILCDNNKSLPALVTDNSNGIGRLECLSAKVNEIANGAYVAELIAPVTAEHFEDIKNGGIVKLKANDLSGVQLFRITKISKPLGGQVTINLNHITYDLNKTSVLPFTATGATASINAIKNNMVSKDSYPFTFTTDISNSTSQMILSEPRSARACLGGVEGSFLDTFGFVQYEWDNLEVKALSHRGADKGVRLAYGKNITDIKQDENIETMYTAVMPYVIRDDVAVMGDLQTIVNTTYPKVLNLDVSQYFDSDADVTKAQINAKAQQYIENNDLTSPKISIDVSFVALWQTEEYKDIAPLERVGLFDTVTVSFSPLGIESKATVTEYVYDVLEERYESIHLGNYRSTLGTTIVQMINTDIQKSDQSNFISAMTNVILNSLGLFSTKVQKANGGYQYYLHNKPELSESQYQWTINAGGFAVSQDYGQTWSAGITSEGDAVFNSIWTAKLIANQIVAGILQDQSGKNFWNMETGEFSLSSSTTVGGETVNEIAKSVADSSSSDAISAYDKLLTQQAVLNKLTNNGAAQGIYLNNGQLYINGEYLNAKGATIGGFQVDDTSIHTKNVAITNNATNSVALSSSTFTRTINGTSRGSLKFAIGSNFGIDNTGKLYASGVELTGALRNNGSTFYTSVSDGSLKGGRIDPTGYLNGGVVLNINYTSGQYYLGPNFEQRSMRAAFIIGTSGVVIKGHLFTNDTWNMQGNETAFSGYLTFPDTVTVKYEEFYPRKDVSETYEKMTWSSPGTSLHFENGILVSER